MTVRSIGLRNVLCASRRYLLVALDLSILTVLSFVLWHFIAENRSQSPVEVTYARDLLTLNAGMPFPLPDAPWASHRLTVVLVLQTTCRACETSTTFYKQLLERALDLGDVGVIAIAPESPAELRSWLSRHELDDIQIVAGNPRELGLRATPTLVLVDQGGQIADIAVGVLSQRAESLVLERLSGNRSAAKLPVSFLEVVAGTAALQSLRASATVELIDFRERHRCSRGDGDSRCIPLVELGVRIPIELAPDALVVIDCRSVRPKRCRSAASSVARIGRDQVFALVEENK